MVRSLRMRVPSRMYEHLEATFIVLTIVPNRPRSHSKKSKLKSDMAAIDGHLDADFLVVYITAVNYPCWYRLFYRGEGDFFIDQPAEDRDKATIAVLGDRKGNLKPNKRDNIARVFSRVKGVEDAH